MHMASYFWSLSSQTHTIGGNIRASLAPSSIENCWDIGPWLWVICWWRLISVFEGGILRETGKSGFEEQAVTFSIIPRFTESLCITATRHYFSADGPLWNTGKRGTGSECSKDWRENAGAEILKKNFIESQVGTVFFLSPLLLLLFLFNKCCNRSTVGVTYDCHALLSM